MENVFGVRTKLSYNKFISLHLLAIEKIQIIIYKPVSSGLPILEISKAVIYEVWYDYMKSKYGEKQSYIKWIHIAL